MKRLGFALMAVVMLVGGCSSTTPATTAPVEGETATTTVVTTTTTEGAAAAVAVDRDLVYHTDDQRDWTVDVFHPIGEGPWPLVVAIPTSESLEYVGPQLADRGMVAVVADSWSTAAWQDAGSWFDGEMNRAACVVGWAQAHSGDYNANAAATTITGYSGGASPVAWVGLGLADDTMCEHRIETPPVGLVVGESQFLFHNRRWDASFASSDPEPLAVLDGYFNADRWEVSPDLQVALWSATTPQYEVRPVGDPPDAESWIWLREAATPVVDDLIELGAFDDERFDFSDNAVLLHHRMREAGVSVQIHTYDIDHEYTDEVYDLILSIQP